MNKKLPIEQWVVFVKGQVQKNTRRICAVSRMYHGTFKKQNVPWYMKIC